MIVDIKFLDDPMNNRMTSPLNIFESHSYPMKPPYPGWGPQSIANPVEVFLWLNSMVCGYNEVDNYSVV
jgi:hypothetical protein